MNFKDFTDTEKVLYIMRGISGSGKSTLAKKIQDREGGVIYSSDEFRYVDGVYTFDPETDFMNHKLNIWRAHKAMQEGISPIIIDNTNVKFEHAKPYIIDALNYGYDVKVIEPNTPWAFNALELAKRNSGRAPLEVIQRMINDYEPNKKFVNQINNLKAPIGEAVLSWPWPKTAKSAAWENIKSGQKFWLDPNGDLYWLAGKAHGEISKELYPPTKNIGYEDEIDYTITNMIKHGWIRTNIVGKSVYVDGTPNKVQRKTLKDMAIFIGGFVRRDEAPWTSFAEAVEITEEQKKELFDNLAQEQRGKPEHAMLVVQRIYGGGVLSPVVEHTGDLIHRMSERVTWEYGGFEYVLEKVNRVLSYLTHKYGFEREMEENFRANAQFRNLNPEQLKQKTFAALDEYAKEHAKLPTYNEVQWRANRAAIKVGTRDWQMAIVCLQNLKADLDKGWKHWAQRAHEYNPKYFKPFQYHSV